MIQLMKRSMRYRSTHNSEAVIVNQMLARFPALSRNLVSDSVKPLRTFQQSRELDRDLQLARKNQERGDSSSMAQLLGSATATSTAERRADLCVLHRMVSELADSAELLPADSLENCVIRRFKRAQLPTGEVIWSGDYQAAFKSVSNCGLVEYPGEGHCVSHFLGISRKRGSNGAVSAQSEGGAAAAGPGDGAGEVEAGGGAATLGTESGAVAARPNEAAQRVEAGPPQSEAADETLWLAVCDVYGPLTQVNTFAGDFWLAPSSGLVPPKPHEVNYPVELATISRKVVWCDGSHPDAQMVPAHRGYIYQEYPQNIPSMDFPV